MDALESRERANRSAIDAGMRKIKLYNFIARDGTGIGYANGDCDSAVGGDLRLAYFRVRIIEGGETQTVTERIERRLREETVTPGGRWVWSERRGARDGVAKRELAAACRRH